MFSENSICIVCISHPTCPSKIKLFWFFNSYTSSILMTKTFSLHFFYPNKGTSDDSRVCYQVPKKAVHLLLTSIKFVFNLHPFTRSNKIAISNTNIQNTEKELTPLKRMQKYIDRSKMMPKSTPKYR